MKLKAKTYFKLAFTLILTCIIGFIQQDSIAQTYSGSKTVNSSQNMSLNVVVDSLAKTVAITMTGPDNVWYA